MQPCIWSCLKEGGEKRGSSVFPSQSMIQMQKPVLGSCPSTRFWVRKLKEFQTVLTISLKKNTCKCSRPPLSLHWFAYTSQQESLFEEKLEKRLRINRMSKQSHTSLWTQKFSQRSKKLSNCKWGGVDGFFHTVLKFYT